MSAKLNQERAPWLCPDLHWRIVSAALDGARAMAAYQDGFLSSVRSCSHTIVPYPYLPSLQPSNSILLDDAASMTQ